MSRMQLLLVASLVTLAAAPGARGQTTFAPPSGIPANCTYTTCALRVEQGFFNRRLVSGAQGAKVGRPLGSFGGGIDILLAGPDSAAYHANKYSRNTWTSTSLLLLSLLAYVSASSQFEHSESNAVSLSIVGIGFSLASIPFTLQAQRDLSRSVWWYNSALPH